MAPEPWLDLSTGINPHGYPVPDQAFGTLRRLPQPAALEGLEEAARRAYKAPAGCHAVALAGTQSLISLLPFLFPARRVGVLGPTYGEYARCFRAAGAEVVQGDDISALEDMDVAIVVNPNNPDGRLVSIGDLRLLAERLGLHGGLLVVDEAFMDFLPPAASLIPFMPEAGVLVLRSFGKAFGLPGLRLGFALTSSLLAARLRGALGPWPVSGPAIAIGVSALADEAWLIATRKTLIRDAGALEKCLRASNLSICGGTPLFRLVAYQKAMVLFERLGRAGILVRRFDQRPDWLRLAIPGRAGDLERLRAALVAV